MVDHLFDMYVTKEVKNSIFYNRNDIATLTEEMVDMIMDGLWTPEELRDDSNTKEPFLLTSTPL